MKPNIAPTLKNYNFKNLSKDLLAGIIIMAVSIPISMGYAQIAGLFRKKTTYHLCRRRNSYFFVGAAAEKTDGSDPPVSSGGRSKRVYG